MWDIPSDPMKRSAKFHFEVKASREPVTGLGTADAISSAS